MQVVDRGAKNSVLTTTIIIVINYHNYYAVVAKSRDLAGQEARNADKFAELYSSCPDVYVPRIYWCRWTNYNVYNIICII